MSERGNCGRISDCGLGGRQRCEFIGVLRTFKELRPWVLRICGRAEGGVWSGEGGTMEVLAFDSRLLSLVYRLSHVCFGGVGAKVCGARGFFGFARGVLVRARGASIEV